MRGGHLLSWTVSGEVRKHNSTIIALSWSAEARYPYTVAFHALIPPIREFVWSRTQARGQGWDSHNCAL